MNGRTSRRASDAPAWLAALAAAAFGAGCIAVGCTLDSGGTAGTGGATGTSSSSSSSSSSSGAAGGGGEGGSGGNQGGGGAGGAPLQELVRWDAAEEVVQGDGTYALPSWLDFVSSSTGKTVQTGPSTLRTGFGADAPRARNVGRGWGLAVESQRENRVGWARVVPAGWTESAGVTTQPATGPDGMPGAVRLSDMNTAGASSVYADVAPGFQGEPATLSVWVADVAQANLTLIGSSRFSPQGAFIPTHAGWARYAVTDTEENVAPSLVQLYPATGGLLNLGAATFDYVSFETGRYPSSVIVTTTGATANRQAERLLADNADPVQLAPGGRFHVRLVFAPYYAPGEQASDHDLLFFDPSNRVFLERASNAVVVMAGGSPVITTPALAFGREDAITVELVHTGADVTLRVTDTVRTTESTAPIGAPLPFPDPLPVLGDTGASQECADLRAITFYVPR